MKTGLYDAERRIYPEAVNLQPASEEGDSYDAAVARSLAGIRDRIVAAGGDPAKVTIVAVTKGFGPEASRAALRAGLTEIGENYAAELLEKAARLKESGGPLPRWHFLGRVQRNKVPRLAPVVSCWQAVARVEEAAAIAARSAAPEMFVEVDASLSPARGGCDPADVPALVAAATGAGCRVRGLMTVAPLATDGDSPAQQEASRRAFDLVARLGRELDLPELSMGMSADLEAAVGAGSTMVRVGTALFGERPAEDPPMTSRGLQQ